MGQMGDKGLRQLRIGKTSASWMHSGRGGRYVSGWLSAMAVLLLLVGCGGSDGDPEPTATPLATPPATPIPTAVPTLAIGEVTWTLSVTSAGEPGEAVTQFPRSADVIYALVSIEHAHPGSEFSATWTVDGLPVEGVSDTVVIENGAVSGWVSFSLTWNGEALWPVGELGVTISADTGEASSGAILITSN